jgi:hypothetical protein
MQDLSWHRGTSTGAHYTDVTGNVEFKAIITKTDRRTWYLATWTFGLMLTGSEHRTLAEAKAKADITYRNVEVAA